MVTNYSKLALAGLALLFGANSCSSVKSPGRKVANFYLADDRDLASIRRVMVLPFDLADGIDADQDMLRQQFIGELVKVQRFEVVPLPSNAEEDRLIHESLEKGHASLEAMVSLANRYELDGIIVGRITNYRAYLPPVIGMQARLFSVHSGSWVWVAEGNYDANDATTVEDLQHYALSFQAEESSMHGWELNLISPARFAKYVSHRIAGTWK